MLVGECYFSNNIDIFIYLFLKRKYLFSDFVSYSYMTILTCKYTCIYNIYKRGPINSSIIDIIICFKNRYYNTIFKNRVYNYPNSNPKKMF